VESDQGPEQAYPVRVVEDPATCRGGHHALVLVKSWQTARAARQLAECLAEDGVALTLQNGLGNYETLSETLGPKRAALGVTTSGANLVAPGLVRAAGEGVITVNVHARLKPLADLMRKAGFVVETVPDASALVWGKLVINAAINPLTALLGVPNGALLERPSARRMLGIVAREAAGVAVARGVPLPYPDPVVAVESIARRTAPNRSSMLQDVSRGAPTEIDAINGEIVRAGEVHSVPTPINRTLWLLVSALAREG
jgi:2-dehydropantoate 2-reductase